MKALFLQILSLCLSASIVALLVMGLRLLLKKAPRSLICALWALVALRLLIPVFPESKLSVLPEKVGSGQIVTEISERTAEDTRIVREDEPLFAELIRNCSPRSRNSSEDVRRWGRSQELSSRRLCDRSFCIPRS